MRFCLGLVLFLKALPVARVCVAAGRSAGWGSVVLAFGLWVLAFRAVGRLAGFCFGFSGAVLVFVVFWLLVRSGRRMPPAGSPAGAFVFVLGCLWCSFLDVFLDISAYLQDAACSHDGSGGTRRDAANNSLRSFHGSSPVLDAFTLSSCFHV